MASNRFMCIALALCVTLLVVAANRDDLLVRLFEDGDIPPFDGPLYLFEDEEHRIAFCRQAIEEGREFFRVHGLHHTEHIDAMLEFLKHVCNDEEILDKMLER